MFFYIILSKDGRRFPGDFRADSLEKICLKTILKPCPVELFLEKKIDRLCYWTLLLYKLIFIKSSQLPLLVVKISELDDFYCWCRFSRDMEIFSYEFYDLKSAFDYKKFV